MNVIKRYNQIEEILRKERYISVDDLAERLQISVATVRRDFTAMEEYGVIKRTRGGAFLAENPPYQKVGSISTRAAVQTKEKETIAKYAASLIRSNEHIFIDFSSTTALMVPYIEASGVTVMTNSYYAIPPLVQKGLHVYVLNGIAHESGQILSEDTLSRLRNFNFDKAFLGTYGVSLEAGFTGYNPIDGEFKKLVIQQSKESYTLMDNTKFGNNAFYSYAPATLTTIITDKATGETGKFKNVVIAPNEQA